MSGRFQHRGVQYSVEALGEQRWRWEIFPPTCVLGLRKETGEIEGDHSDAVCAVHKAIEQQVGLN